MFQVFDLLDNKTMLRVYEDGKKEVQVVGLQEVQVASECDVSLGYFWRLLEVHGCHSLGS